MSVKIGVLKVFEGRDKRSLALYYDEVFKDRIRMQRRIVRERGKWGRTPSTAATKKDGEATTSLSVYSFLLYENDDIVVVIAVVVVVVVVDHIVYVPR